MKTIITSIMSVALAGFALSPMISSAEEEMAKPVILEGTATCPKCDLGTAEECGNVLQVKEGDKTVIYQLAGKVDMDWHKKICKAPKEVKATGTVTEKDGKKTLVVTEIEMLEKAEKK